MREALMARGVQLLWGGLVCSVVTASLASAAEMPFSFRDVGDETGLFPAVGGIAGHGVGWGDVDGDGWADLYVGTFGGHPYDSKNNQFFRNRKGKFELDDQPHLRISGRANGALFADWDNDGDLDLYVTNHAITQAGQPHYSTPNALFRNDGGGKFTDVSAASNACPQGIAARSATVLDYDGDGRLDLLVGECFFQGGMSRSRLYRNTGGLVFENVTTQVGLPAEITGFGVAAGDVNQDGRPDLFIGGRHHGNRLFLNQAGGKFIELPKSHGDFQWEYKDTPDDTACGVCFGDVNRDGLIDLVVGSHCDRPWYTGNVPVRLYLNRGVAAGVPKFEDVTQAAGLIPLPMKSPHVEIQDFDNDGWPDIYTSIVLFADARTGKPGQPHPVIFKNQAAAGDTPRFQQFAVGVNDFPTAEDRALADVGKFFAKMEREHKVIYMAPGPTCDYDRDGRLDMFLGNWWVKERSLLLRNESPAGNWLQVAVEGPDGVNRMGIGAMVRIYAAGKLGDAGSLLGVREISAGYGYASGQEALAHFGLGKTADCDLEVILPHGKGRLERRNVAANQRLLVKSDK